MDTMSFMIRDGLADDIPACLALDADYLATGHYARIARDENGIYQRTHQHITTGPEVKTHAVRHFQKEMI